MPWLTRSPRSSPPTTLYLPPCFSPTSEASESHSKFNPTSSNVEVPDSHDSWVSDCPNAKRSDVCSSTETELGKLVADFACVAVVSEAADTEALQDDPLPLPASKGKWSGAEFACSTCEAERRSAESRHTGTPTMAPLGPLSFFWKRPFGWRIPPDVLTRGRTVGVGGM
ncbi:unnamed protein product [Ectocarpus fasciculatus]